MIIFRRAELVICRDFLSIAYKIWMLTDAMNILRSKEKDHLKSSLEDKDTFMEWDQIRFIFLYSSLFSPLTSSISFALVGSQW